jgi:Zn-dependent peptidase ImmA (M78 family)/DNA-binding XRE family transcriptional regulator
MISQRMKQLRQARGMSLGDLAAALDGAVTKQALSKYELGKARPSPRMLTQLARVFGIQPSQLLAPPTFTIEIIGYRRRATLPKREQARLESQIAETLLQRVQLQDRLQLAASSTIAIQSLPITQVAEAEQAAETLRETWELGSEPLANLTATLEDHHVHVLNIDGDARFAGFAAVARDETGPRAAAIICDHKASGERQRLNLAHELGHLVLDVSALPAEEIEASAFRFGAALLAPAAHMRQQIGERRSHLTTEELLLLKQHFGLSIQALLRRMCELQIITETYYRQWQIDISRLGWRKQEPNELPREEPTWLRRQLLRGIAEELLTPDEAIQLEPSLANSPLLPRRAALALTLAERRQLLAEQANQLAATYTPDPDWQALQGDDILDEY